MRPALAALVVVACGGNPVPAPRPLAPPAPGPRDPDLVRMPDDVWAIGAIDLAQLRESTARRWVWQLLAEHSPIARRCRDELAAGTRVTVGLRERERDHYSSSTFAIVHGIDRAAMTACLHGKLRDLPELPPNHEPCDGFDAAVHALATCGQVPKSHADGVHAFIERLASEGAAVCPSAAHALEAANARRVELGWTCEIKKHRDRTEAHIYGKATDVDRDTVALGDYELVHFVDDHTLEIGSAEAFNGAESREASIAALAELRPSAKARWFETSARTIDVTRGAWIVADLKALVKEPVAVAASVGLRGDVAIDLQLANPPSHLVNQAISVAERALADPLAAGVRVELGCSPAVTPPRTPQFLACEAAEDHLQILETSKNIDAKGLLDERAQRCVADNWPADYVACVAATATPRDWDRCYQQLSAADRERIEAGQTSACGKRAFHVRVTVPDRRIEVLKLVGALDHATVRDCRAPAAGPPEQLTVGKSYDDLRVARLCFRVGEGDTAENECSLVALDDTAGVPRDRFGNGYDLTTGRCVGPLNLAPTLQSPNGNCDNMLAGVLPAFDQRPSLSMYVSKPGLSLCAGTACTILPHSDVVAIASDGKLAAARVGEAIETWDLVAHKKLARFAIGKGCADVSIAGALVVVGCGAKSYLAKPTGARMAAIGDALIAPLVLGPGRWGFVARTGDALVGYDGATGKEVSRVALPHGDAGMVAAAGDGDGRVVVAYGGPGVASGTVVVVDGTATRTFQQVACPTAAPAGH